MNLDKLYTKTHIAQHCYKFLVATIPNLNDAIFLEPSAGNGVFLPFLEKFEAYDIKPEAADIVQQNFLTFDSNYHEYVTIGNPPFGKRSALAIQFFNKCAIYSKVIGFILPISFMKWGVQKELNKDFKLVDYLYLPENSFLDGDKDYSIRTVFQVWAKESLIDKRLKKAPPISHPDFKIWQHNATEGSRKYVDEDWEIATYRQGYNDYNELFYRKDYEKLKNFIYTTNKQFFFIQPLTEEARSIILNMDFNSLAERNISTPGFGKADFVSYYLELTESK